MADISRRKFILTGAGAGAAALSVPAGAKPLLHMKNKGTGYACSPRFTEFYQNSFEVPERVNWINKRIEESGLINSVSVIEPHSDPMSWIEKVHTREHIEGIQARYNNPYNGDYTEPMADAAELAVGHVLGAVDQVCTGKLKNAFCAVRPPGHHVVNHGFSAGYCVYANVVLAAYFAMQQHGIERVMIIDWDFHHGNSTEDFVCDNGSNDLFPTGSVQFFETFGSIVYYSGCPSTPDIGTRSSDKTNTTNVYMGRVYSPDEGYGITNQEFERAFDEVMVPIADKFKPQLVLVSSGFDLKANDTHGYCQVTGRGVSSLTRKVMQIADQYADGKLVSMLEGGYADAGTEYTLEEQTFHGLTCCAESHLATLSDGQLQPECDYYKASRVSTGASSRTPQPVHFRNGILTLEASPVLRVKVTDAAGRLVTEFDPGEVYEGRIDLREAVTKPGWYSVQVELNAKRTRVFSWLHSR